MDIKEFLNRKYYDLQSQKAGKINVEEFASLFGAKQPLMSKWLNGERVPGPEYKKRIIDYYGEEAILAFGEDPDLYAVNQNWEHLSPEARRSYREQIEQKALENDIKRTSQKRRTRTVE
jgi:transcriptional regulator with XRE-family HTH domain